MSPATDVLIRFLGLATKLTCEQLCVNGINRVARSHMIFFLFIFFLKIDFALFEGKY